MCIKPTSASIRSMKAFRGRVQYNTMTKASKQMVVVAFKRTQDKHTLKADGTDSLW